jgi:hypothetical protein
MLLSDEDAAGDEGVAILDDAAADGVVVTTMEPDAIAGTDADGTLAVFVLTSRLVSAESITIVAVVPPLTPGISTGIG